MHRPRKGKEAAKSMLSEFKEAFPNISFRAYQHPLIAEGPYVVGRWIGGGKHTGAAFDDLAVGTLASPNTGKEMYFSDTTIFTLPDGKIVDETGEEGALIVLQQLGLVQGPNPGKEVRYQLE
ncbi:polyketide cyclase SnoaL-like domain-containing protein [Lipomyces tetrasporus]